MASQWSGDNVRNALFVETWWESYARYPVTWSRISFPQIPGSGRASWRREVFSSISNHLPTELELQQPVFLLGGIWFNTKQRDIISIAGRKVWFKTIVRKIQFNLFFLSPLQNVHFVAWSNFSIHSLQLKDRCSFILRRYILHFLKKYLSI